MSTTTCTYSTCNYATCSTLPPLRYWLQTTSPIDNWLILTDLSSLQYLITTTTYDTTASLFHAVFSSAHHANGYGCCFASQHAIQKYCSSIASPSCLDFDLALVFVRTAVIAVASVPVLSSGGGRRCCCCSFFCRSRNRCGVIPTHREWNHSSHPSHCTCSSS